MPMPRPTSPVQLLARLALLLGLVTSCRAELDSAEGRREAFHERVAMGRRVSYGLLSETSGYGLSLKADPSVVKLYGDGASAGIGRILYDTRAMPLVKEDELESYADAFIAANEAALLITRAELARAPRFRSDVTPKLTILSYLQTRAERPVRDAYLELAFMRDQAGEFHLSEAVNRTYSEAVANPGEPSATMEQVRRATGYDELTLVSERRIVFAVNRSPDRRELLNATEFEASLPESGETYVITMADGSEEILESYSHRVDANPILKAPVYERSYLDRQVVPTALPLVNLSPGDDADATDFDGGYTKTVAGDREIELASPRVRVFEGSATEPFRIPAALDGAKDTLLTANDDQKRALNAYVAVHRINRFVRRHLTESETPFLDEPLPVFVKFPGSCNAYYDFAISVMRLFGAGNGCADTALINDVIYHEWGHGLDAFTGRVRGIQDRAFSEGIGDIVATYFTGIATVGSGFFVGDPNGIRRVSTTVRYPSTETDEHLVGLIIGGTFWDLRQGFIKRHGKVQGSYEAERLFFRHLLTTDSYLDSYQAVLRLDDDDGNPATPSPHHCLINAAFAKHGLADDEACEDRVSSDAKPPVDETLQIGIQSEDEDGAKLMIAAADADAVTICLGDEAQCRETPTDDVTFELEGRSADSKKQFFTSTEPLALANQMILTIQAKDGDGKVIGLRTFKLSGK